MTTQPLATPAIQALLDAATPGAWWRDGSEIHAGEPGAPAASTWVAETVNLTLPDHGEANAAAIVTTHNAMPALLARVAELEAENEQLRTTSRPPHFGTPHASFGDAVAYAMERNARLAADAAAARGAR